MKANKLLSACDFAERCRLARPCWRVDKSISGSGGRTGASHLPLLQQKEACSPCKRSAPQVGHALFQTGMVQRVRPIAFAKLTHQPMGDAVLGVGCLHKLENICKGVVKAYIRRHWWNRQMQWLKNSVRDVSWLRMLPSRFPRLLYFLLLVVVFVPVLTAGAFLVSIQRHLPSVVCEKMWADRMCVVGWSGHVSDTVLCGGVRLAVLSTDGLLVRNSQLVSGCYACG